jgi:diadenosine tetraphosphate (Ap4A) HIT family hydrolase
VFHKKLPTCSKQIYCIVCAAQPRSKNVMKRTLARPGYYGRSPSSADPAIPTRTPGGPYNSRVRVLLILLASVALADVRNCACDAAKPETMVARECGLCREAENQPADVAVFFLKDINPRKPNRWLALPRAHVHSLAAMTPATRHELWSAAIEKARSLWGAEWGLAVNGDERRTQCHAHIHIGKLLDGVENADFVQIDGPAKIVIPTDGTGFWVHQVGTKLHVHPGEQVTEFVLMR